MDKFKVKIMLDEWVTKELIKSKSMVVGEAEVGSYSRMYALVGSGVVKQTQIPKILADPSVVSKFNLMVNNGHIHTIHTLKASGWNTDYEIKSACEEGKLLKYKALSGAPLYLNTVE